MFTGLIKKIGKVEKFTPLSEGALIAVKWPNRPSEIELGDSVSVNGVCVTANKLSANSFEALLSKETLERTSLAKLSTDSSVNLELPIQGKSFMGGHFVQGHVDGVGEVFSIESVGECWKVVITIPENLGAYVAKKGSIAIDGISLTINEVISPSGVEVMIIPHTWENTIAHTYRPTTKVNLEVDILAKYIHRALERTQEALQA